MILNNSKIQKHYNPSNLFKISYLIIKNIIIHEFENLEKVEDMILDLEDEINDFLEKKNPKILSLHYQVAMTFSSELEYSFSCLIEYEDK